MDNSIPFEALPKIVAEMNKKIDLLIADRKTPIIDEDSLMNMEILRDYLPDKPARQTVYGWVNEKKIPYEKYGRRLYFRKSKIDKWIANGRQV